MHKVLSPHLQSSAHSNITAFQVGLTSEKVVQKLTDAFFRFESTEIAQTISSVLQLLEAAKHNGQK